MEKKRIGVKDLVNIGIFAVLYFIAFFIAGITGFIPVMTVFYSVVLAVLGGIPCILFFTKTDKFGMVTILCDGIWALRHWHEPDLRACR